MLERVDLRGLKAVIAVAEEGTFLGAADVLHLTQSAVSQQIARLEHVIGAQVFDRPGGPRPVTITPVGEIVLRRARAIIAQLEAGGREIDAVIRGTGGRLRCGTFQSVSVHFLPVIIAELIKEAPGLDVVIEEEIFNEDILRRLIDGEFDVAFHSLPVDDPAIESIPLGQDPFVAILPKGSSLTPKFKNGSVKLYDLASGPMIGEYDDQDLNLVEGAIRALGLNPRYAFRTTDNGAVQAMVGAGLGAAIMPELTLDAHVEGITRWPIDPPVPPRTLYVALPRDSRRTKSAERFAQIAKQVGRDRLKRVPTS